MYNIGFVVAAKESVTHKEDAMKKTAFATVRTIAEAGTAFGVPFLSGAARVPLA